MCFILDDWVTRVWLFCFRVAECVLLLPRPQYDMASGTRGLLHAYAQVAGKLNLKAHAVHAADKRSFPDKVTMFLAGDCEGHVSHVDGRL